MPRQHGLICNEGSRRPYCGGRMSLSEYKQGMAQVFGLPLSRFGGMNKEQITFECVHYMNDSDLNDALHDQDSCVIKLNGKSHFFQFGTTYPDELRFMSEFLPNMNDDAAIVFSRLKKLGIYDLYHGLECGRPTWVDYILRVTDDELLKSWELVQSVRILQELRISRTDSFVRCLPDGSMHINGIVCYSGGFNWAQSLPHGFGRLFTEDCSGLQDEDTGENVVEPSDGFELVGNFTSGLLNGPGLMKKHGETDKCVFRLSVPYRISDLDWQYGDLQQGIARLCGDEPVVRCRNHLRSMVDGLTCSASAKTFLVEVFIMIAGDAALMNADEWCASWRKVQLFCTSRLYFDQGVALQDMPFPAAVIEFLHSEPFTLDELIN